MGNTILIPTLYDSGSQPLLVGDTLFLKLFLATHIWDKIPWFLCLNDKFAWSFLKMMSQKFCRHTKLGHYSNSIWKGSKISAIRPRIRIRICSNIASVFEFEIRIWYFCKFFDYSKLFGLQTLRHFFQKGIFICSVYGPPLGLEKVVKGVGLTKFLIKKWGRGIEINAVP